MKAFFIVYIFYGYRRRINTKLKNPEIGSTLFSKLASLESNIGENIRTSFRDFKTMKSTGSMKLELIPEMHYYLEKWKQ